MNLIEAQRFIFNEIALLKSGGIKFTNIIHNGSFSLELFRRLLGKISYPLEHALLINMILFEEKGKYWIEMQISDVNEMSNVALYCEDMGFDYRFAFDSLLDCEDFYEMKVFINVNDIDYFFK